MYSYPGFRVIEDFIGRLYLYFVFEDSPPSKGASDIIVPTPQGPEVLTHA
jgi:hypothetical protein